jgi:cyclase
MSNGLGTINMNRLRNICRFGLVSLAALIFSCQPSHPFSIDIKKINPRVLVLNFLDVNITAVKSGSGIILIDTNRSPHLMAELKKIIEKEFGLKNFRYVINTHGHSDHSGGNQLFPDSVIIAQENCPEYMRQIPADYIYGLWYPRQHLTELTAQLGEFAKGSPEYQKLQAEIKARQILLEDLESDYKVTVPAKTFRDSLVIPAGDLTIKLWYVGNAHTNHDIVVFIPEENLALTGDLFNDRNSFGFPINKMIDSERLIQVIDKVLLESNEELVIIPGHDELLAFNDLLHLRDLLQERSSEFDERNSAAATLEKMIGKKGLETAIKICRESLVEATDEYYCSEEEFNILSNRLLGSGKTTAGLEVSKLAIEIFPDSPLAYDNLGGAYIRNGEIQLAIESYERSLQLAPYNRNAAEILKILHKK